MADTENFTMTANQKQLLLQAISEDDIAAIANVIRNINDRNTGTQVPYPDDSLVPPQGATYSPDYTGPRVDLYPPITSGTGRNNPNVPVNPESGVIIDTEPRIIDPDAPRITQLDIFDPLMRATFWNDIEEMRRLLAAGVDVNKASQLGTRPLHLVQSKEAADLLIENGADVNVKDNKGRTPLHAVHNKEAVEVLLRAGADAKAKDDEGRTPLFTATKDTIPLLIEAGAEINAQDDNGKTALHELIVYNRDAAIALIRAGADVNIKDDDGRTPIFERNYGVDTLEEFIKAGADLTVQDEKGNTPLHAVLGSWDSPEKIELMLKSGADVNAQNEDKNTALHLAHSFYDIQKLIEGKADCCIKNEKGNTPLMEKLANGDAGIDTIVLLAEQDYSNLDEATKRKQDEMLEEWANRDPANRAALNRINDPLRNLSELDRRLFEALEQGRTQEVASLIEQGANVNATDREGNSPLHKATTAEQTNLLIEAGADVKAKNKEGETPLHTAKTAEQIAMLIEAGADVNAQDNKGKTPLHNAQTWNQVNKLLQSGATVDVRDQDGNTPLHIGDKSAGAMRLLIGAGIDVNAKNNEGQTPLHMAKNIHETRLLIDGGADVNMADNKGNTALHYARNINQARLLVASGADVKALNADNQTALMRLIEEYKRGGNDVYAMFRMRALIDYLAQQDYTGLDPAIKEQQDMMLDTLDGRMPEVRELPYPAIYNRQGQVNPNGISEPAYSGVTPSPEGPTWSATDVAPAPTPEPSRSEYPTQPTGLLRAIESGSNQFGEIEQDNVDKFRPGDIRRQIREAARTGGDVSPTPSVYEGIHRDD